MNYIEKLRATLDNVTKERETKQTELNSLEEEFSNVKLNPYGVTSIDFGKRQDMAVDIIKMEGVIMGLTLALETYEES